MRLATFNLENLDFDKPDSPAFVERLSILRPQLDRLAGDVLCLQEVNSQRHKGKRTRGLLALDQLLAGTEYENYHRAVSSRHDGSELPDVHNLVVLSRYPVHASRSIHHDHMPSWNYEAVTAQPVSEGKTVLSWDRPILRVDLEMDSGTLLTIFNVHFRAPLAVPVAGQKLAPFVWKSVGGWAEGYFLSALKRTGQALELRLALEQLLDADPDRHVAVCGDFNSCDHETAFRIVVAGEEDTGNGQLARRSLVPLDRSVAEDRRYSVVHHGRPQMLDHILVTRSLLGHYQNLEIHNETIGDELVGYAKVDRPPDSYHAPIVASFDFRK